MNKIDAFNKTHNQVQYVQDLLENPSKFDNHKTYLSDLRLLAIYLRDCKNYKPKERQQFLEEFCSKYSENYDEILWISVIQRAMNYSANKKQKLKTIAFPLVYDFEFNYINNLELDENYKKILFCSLVFYKFEVNRRSYVDKTNFYVPNFVLNPVDIKKYSGVKLAKGEDVAYLHGDLDEMGLLGYSPKRGGQIIANFIENIDYNQSYEDFVVIKNPKNAGLYFQYFIDKTKVGFCKTCGDIFKKTTNYKLYCKDCSKGEKVASRLISCIDCGKEFTVNIKNTETCRCEQCYKKHRREKIAENVKIFRSKSKM